jgi:hypothetical protein
MTVPTVTLLTDSTLDSTDASFSGRRTGAPLSGRRTGGSSHARRTDIRIQSDIYVQPFARREPLGGRRP